MLIIILQYPNIESVQTDMKKDNESLKRIQFLSLAAKMYSHIDSELSSRMIKELILISEKKMIRLQNEPFMQRQKVQAKDMQNLLPIQNCKAKEQSQESIKIEQNLQLITLKSRESVEKHCLMFIHIQAHATTSFIIRPWLLIMQPRRLVRILQKFAYGFHQLHFIYSTSLHIHFLNHAEKAVLYFTFQYEQRFIKKITILVKIYFVYFNDQRLVKNQQKKTQQLFKKVVHQYLCSFNQKQSYIQIILFYNNKQVSNMFAHTNKLFLVMIALSSMTYFQRADYNLPLFAFAILLWNYRQPQQKTRLWYLMSFSLITDVIWIIYWAVTWNSYNNRQLGVCMFVLIISIIQFIVKIVTVIILFTNQPECKSAISNLPSNVKSIVSGPTDYNQ